MCLHFVKQINSKFHHPKLSIFSIMGKKKYGKPNPFAARKRTNRDKEERADRTNEPYAEIVRENALFENFYKHQKICTDNEWESFLKAIRDNLPVTFRVTATRGESERLMEIIKNTFFVEYLKAASELYGETASIESLKPKVLPWYPNNYAWELQLTRKDIRRSEGLWKLHNFLISETESGNISRQEAVSMIPPLVLNVKPHHKVLDLCAAPGSKTAQIIEALHSDGGDKTPVGFVIANDVDNNRCYMLVHQAKRLNSPCCLITNSDAGQFPNLFINEKDGDQLKLIKFDRILADVPCSGDGTLRKNPDIWLKWNLGTALNLHHIQFRIARRGAEMLEVGGRMVYSTCSLNPIENEAVVCRLLRECQGALKIVDASDMIKGLNYNPGMTKWTPATKDLRFFDKFEDVPSDLHSVIHPQMFPPTEEEVKTFNLQHCLRVLPHHQNTGGFFVVALEKTSVLPWEQEVNEKAMRNNERKINNRIAAEAEVPSTDNAVAKDETAEPDAKKKKRAHYGFREDPFIFFEDDEEVFTSLKEFYELSDDFLPKCLLTRCKVGKKKNIYFCSPQIRSILKNNEHNIKLINSGVKTFSRCDNRNMSCSFRIAHEGLRNVLGFIGMKRRIDMKKTDLITLLNNLDPTNPPQQSEFDEESQRQLAAIGSGSCVLHYSEDELDLYLVGWRGTKSLRAYVDTNDTMHMLRLLGADLSKYDISKFKKGQVAQVTETPQAPEDNVDKVMEID